jgi:damage-control phosphatase, subfamily III
VVCVGHDGAGIRFLVASLAGASAESSPFGELSAQDSKALSRFGTLLHGARERGQLVFEADQFQTSQHAYGRIPVVAPELYARLVAAKLVIFKRDLNYRKLVGDRMWVKTTGYREAIGTLGENGKKGIIILALRGCKADVVVRLAKGVEEELRAATGEG